MRENKIEEYLKRQVSRLGGKTRKLQYQHRSNALDRLVLFPLEGKFGMVELKKDTGTQKREQLRYGQKTEAEVLAESGIPVFSADSFDEVDQVILAIRGFN